MPNGVFSKGFRNAPDFGQTFITVKWDSRQRLPANVAVAAAAVATIAVGDAVDVEVVVVGSVATA